MRAITMATLVVASWAGNAHAEAAPPTSLRCTGTQHIHPDAPGLPSTKVENAALVVLDHREGVFTLRGLMSLSGSGGFMTRPEWYEGYFEAASPMRGGDYRYHKVTVSRLDGKIFVMSSESLEFDRVYLQFEGVCTPGRQLF
jgi:hypothetical protein